MIIEFIGGPGAGKTTLIPTVIESLQERGIKAYTVVDAARPYARRTVWGKLVGHLAPPSLRRPLLWQIFYRLSALYRLKFLLKHPRLIWRVWRSQWRRPAAADARRRKVLYWFFRLIGYYEFLQAHLQPREALIFDEGFVHRVVQLHASGVEEPVPAQIWAYLDLLPPPDWVIFIQAPPEVCERRIYSRGLWERLRHKDPAEISRFVANAWFIVNVAVDHLKGEGWRVVEVDNGSDDLVASKAKLRRRLRRMSVPAQAAPDPQASYEWRLP